MPTTELDWVVLEDLRFDAIVGILSFEQARAQPLVLQVELGANLDRCGATGDLSYSVNYAAVANQSRFVAQHGRWRLIESLGTALCRLILAAPAPHEGRCPVQEVALSIAKPTILDGLAVPSVRLRRAASWCELRAFEPTEGVRVEVLEATPLSGAYRVHVAPGASWQPPVGVALYGVTGTLQSDAGPVGPGTEVARLAGPVRNDSAAAALVLAVGTPF